MTWEEMGWDEKSWDEVRRAHMIWDEMKCRVRSASVKCKCEVWGKSSLGVALRRGRAQNMDNNTATAPHKVRAHGPGWCTAHASSIDEKGFYSKSLRQLPPRLVRVLLVEIYTSCFAANYFKLNFGVPNFGVPSFGVPVVPHKTAAEVSKIGNL